MSGVLPVLRLSDVAPELVRRLGWIVAGLASVVARRFLKEPKFFALIIPLWGWLGRSGRRFGRVVVRPVAAREVDAAPVVARVRARVAPEAPGVARVRLPSGRGWLVRALGYEAAGYGSQLEALLREPEMAALLAGLPAVGRILRPLCRMLGVGPKVVRVRVRVARVARPRVKRPVVVVVERRHSPVSSWMHRPAKKRR